MHSDRLAVAEAMGYIDSIAHIKFKSATIKLERGGWEKGEAQTIVDELAESFSIAKQMQRANGIAAIGAQFGQVLAMAGQPSEALAVFEIAASAFETLRQTESAQQIRALQDLVRATPAASDARRVEAAAQAEEERQQAEAALFVEEDRRQAEAARGAEEERQRAAAMRGIADVANHPCVPPSAAAGRQGRVCRLVRHQPSSERSGRRRQGLFGGTRQCRALRIVPGVHSAITQDRVSRFAVVEAAADDDRRSAATARDR